MKLKWIYCCSSAQSVSTSYERQLMKLLCETKRIHFHSNKNSLPTCLLPSMLDPARLLILSQKTVDINRTPVILRCPVIVQKYFVFWLGAQQAKCDLWYRENEFVLRFHRGKKEVSGPKLYKYSGTSLCMEQSKKSFHFLSYCPSVSSFSSSKWTHRCTEWPVSLKIMKEIHFFPRSL